MTNRIHNGHVLGVAASIVPFASVISHLILAPFIAVTALAVLVCAFRERSWPRPPPALMLLMIALLAWGAISLIWSLDPDATLSKLPKLVPTLIAGLIVVDAVRRLKQHEFDVFRRYVIAGFCAGLAVLGTERIASAPLRHLTRYGEDWLADPNLLWVSFNPGAVALSLFVWPVSMLLWRRSARTALLVCATTLFIVAFYPSNTAIAAMVVGGVVFGAAFWSARAAPVVVTALMIFTVLASPAVPRLLPSPEGIAYKSLLTGSGAHRLIIWRFVSEQIAERPVFGWGLNSARSIPGGDDVLAQFAAALPLHPHNMPLQIWLELGAVGAVLVCALVAIIFVAIRRHACSSADRAFAWGLVMSGWVSCFLSYGIWQTWWMATLWFAAAFAIRPARSE